MSDNLKVAKECGARIKNSVATVSGKVCAEVVFTATDLEAYTSRILASQQAAHDAEIARLKEEYDRRVEVWIRKCDSANAACAMKDAALEEAKQIIASLVHEYGRVHTDIEVKCSTLDKAISASPQQVSEWERKQLEPLLAQVAMLRKHVKHDVECEFTKWCWECTCGVESALSNTQSTAEQFIAECEQRGAVKALEEAALKWLPNMRRSDFESSMGKSVHNMAVDDCVKHVLSMAESIRATSKKAG